MHRVSLLFKVLEFALGPMGRASRLALPLVFLNSQGYCQWVSTLSNMLSLVITLSPNPAWVHDNNRGPRAVVTSSL